MAEGQQFQAEPLRSLLFSSILNTYLPIGTSIRYSARQILIQNLTDVLLIFSFDGINDHIALPQGGFYLSDITTNKISTEGYFLATGQSVFVKYVTDVPTSGSAYFSSFHGNRV